MSCSQPPRSKNLDQYLKWDFILQPDLLYSLVTADKVKWSRSLNCFSTALKIWQNLRGKVKKSNLMDMSLGLSIAKVNALPVELYLLPLKSRSCLLLIEHAGG